MLEARQMCESSDSFRPNPFLDGEQWTPKDEYRQNTPIIWKFAPP